MRRVVLLELMGKILWILTTQDHILHHSVRANSELNLPCSQHISGIGLYVQINDLSSEVISDTLYPLLEDEVFLPDCLSLAVASSVVCLRLDPTANTPRLTLANDSDIFFSNTEFSARALFEGSLPAGEISCSSAEGHTISATVAGGEG